MQAMGKMGVSVTVLCSFFSESVRREDFKVEVIPVGYNSLQEFLAMRSKKAGSSVGTTNNWKYLAHQLLWKPFIFPDESFIWKRPALSKALSLLSAEHFDAVISVGLPFSAHLVAKEIKATFPDITWLMDVGDPYALQENHPISNPVFFKKRSHLLERECLLQCDRVAVTNKGMKNKYADTFDVPKEKIRVIPPLNSIQFLDKAPSVTTETIQIGYFGSFFRNIREPKILLDAIGHLDAWASKANLSIQWHFFGNGFERFNLDKRIREYGLSIEVHSKVDRLQITTFMESMNVLLHFGNATDFQIPSKIAEYICSGKSILHVQQIAADPVLPLLKNYPYALEIKTPLEEKDGSAVINFLEKALQHQPDTELVEKHRCKYKPEEIAKEYLELLRSI